MLFDTEEWKVIGDDQRREYLGGVMDNLVEVYPRRGSDYTVHITVPTAFFPYIRDVLKYSQEQLLENRISFYLSEMPKSGWLFGFDRGHGALDDTALWRYPHLPNWAKR